MSHFKSLSIGLLILGFVCSSFVSNEKNKTSTTNMVTLKANEEFIFGEFTFEKTNFKVFNPSKEELQIKVLDEESIEPLMVMPLEPEASFTARLYPWEKVIVQNPSDEDINLIVKSKKIDSGFRIQEMQIHTM